MTFPLKIFPFISNAIFYLFVMAAPPIAGQEALNGNTNASKDFGMDVIIVSTSTKQQQEYWENRLSTLQGKLIGEKAYLFVLLEEWPGGAGNGFGSLHAYQNAQKKAKALYNLDLLEYQRQGHSIAIFHTAGQGKRLSPLTASEKNNKSAVKLPSGLFFAEDQHTIALLEAVIWQSIQLAPYRKGRLSVFWGDQVFLSKNPLKKLPEHEIDIYAMSRQLPSKKKWSSEGLDKYGLFAADTNGECCYLEKASYSTVEKLIEKQKIDPQKNIAISIGSFSITTEMTEALLKEFSQELADKIEIMNVEHSLWMPLSLDIETYCGLMIAMGWSREHSENVYNRMATFKDKYPRKDKNKPLIGVSDIGSDGYWWDYGTIKNYYNNIFKLTKSTDEAFAMRSFFCLSQRENHGENPQLQIDNKSIVLGSTIKSGTIKNSIIIDVEADDVQFEDTLSISCDLKNAAAQKSLLYNLEEKNDSYFTPSTVCANLFFNWEEPLKISTRLERDGKNDWNLKVENNRYSYEELEKLNEINSKKEK